MEKDGCNMSDFNDVMSEYWKVIAKKEQKKKTSAERGEKVYDVKGTKFKCEEIKEMFESGGVILDVRDPIDYAGGGVIHNSINVPAANVVKWVIGNSQITKNTPILLYCDTGTTSQSVKDELQMQTIGYKNVHNIGSHKWYPHCS